MVRFFLISITILISISCEKEQQIDNKIIDGTYIGTFHRELSWGNSDTANITFVFSAENWSGSSNFSKYPALCHGTYSIKGDRIIFNNECAWTAEFDWSLILSGEYILENDDIEFYREYHSEVGTYIDRYKLKKVEE